VLSAQAKQVEKTEYILITGDPQTDIRGIKNHHVWESKAYIDHVIETAQRTPAQAFFGPAVVESVLSCFHDPNACSPRLKQEINKRHGQTTLFLGDALNNACSVEWDVFKKAAGKNWFLAPGNHDFFYLGNTNPKILTSKGIKWYKFGYWLTLQWVLDEHAGWRNYCSGSYKYYYGKNISNKKKSVLLKNIFIIKYLETIQKNYQLKTDIAAKVASKKSGRHSLNENPTGNKAQLKRIAWHRDNDQSNGTEYWALPHWESYLLQEIFANGYSIIIIDTSQYKDRPHMTKNAGERGQLLDNQLRVIKEWLQENKKKGIPTILAGHHPMRSLENSPKELLKEWSKAGYYQMYLSAHTHSGFVDGENPIEYNVPSLIDWIPGIGLLTLPPRGNKPEMELIYFDTEAYFCDGENFGITDVNVVKKVKKESLSTMKRYHANAGHLIGKVESRWLPDKDYTKEDPYPRLQRIWKLADTPEKMRSLACISHRGMESDGRPYRMKFASNNGYNPYLLGERQQDYMMTMFEWSHSPRAFQFRRGKNLTYSLRLAYLNDVKDDKDVALNHGFYGHLGLLYKNGNHRTEVGFGYLTLSDTKEIDEGFGDVYNRLGFNLEYSYNKVFFLSAYPSHIYLGNTINDDKENAWLLSGKFGLQYNILYKIVGLQFYYLDNDIFKSTEDIWDKDQYAIGLSANVLTPKEVFYLQLFTEMRYSEWNKIGDAVQEYSQYNFGVMFGVDLLHIYPN